MSKYCKVNALITALSVTRIKPRGYTKTKCQADCVLRCTAKIQSHAWGWDSYCARHALHQHSGSHVKCRFRLSRHVGRSKHWQKYTHSKGLGMQGDTQIAAQAVASANRSYRVQPISQACAFAWSAHGQSSVAQDRQSQMRCTHLWISANCVPRTRIWVWTCRLS